MVQLRNGRGRDDEGIALVLVALCMVGVLAVAAIVVDLGNARQVRRGVQGGVDAAALAGAQELPTAANNGPTRLTKQSAARNQAMIYATNNLVGSTATPPRCDNTALTTCTGTVGNVSLTVSTPWNPTAAVVPAINDPHYTDYLGYVFVKACQPTQTFFAGVVRQKSPNVCRTAVGRYTTVGNGFDYGLVATDPDDCPALTFAGNSATQLTSNGAVMVNSNCESGSTQALDSNGSSWKLRFVDSSGAQVPGYIGVVGGATLNPCDPLTNASCTITVPTTGIAPFGDPLSDMQAPTKPSGPAATCDNNGGRITPGLYSECMVTSNNANLDMEPGIYYVTGDFKFTGGNIRCVDGATMKCTGTDPSGIMIYIVPSPDGRQDGQFTLTGNGTVSLPPYHMSCSQYYTGACYDGMSVWQTGTKVATINGTNNFSIGTIYIPNALLKANGSGGGAAINVTGIVVAKTVEISGTFDFNIKVPINADDTTPQVDLGLEK